MLVKLCVFMSLARITHNWSTNDILFLLDYFTFKSLKHVSYVQCSDGFDYHDLAKKFIANKIHVSVYNEDFDSLSQGTPFLKNVPIGIIAEGRCDFKNLFQQVRYRIFNANRAWVIFIRNISNEVIMDPDEYFQDMPLSMDADFVIVKYINQSYYELSDLFKYGSSQASQLQMQRLGYWDSRNGLNITFNGFKYYQRWDFNNITLRGISVVLSGAASSFDPALLSEDRFTTGVSAMTKITAQILEVLREQHNFRFQYTITDRWVGSPMKNSTLAVTNSMAWQQQDISVTCLRIFPKWLDWMDAFFPPITFLETKFFYLIPEEGVGDFENQFLTPMSPSVWWCSLAAIFICGLLLTMAAAVERRPDPGYYAIFTVVAATCQQAFEDGINSLQYTFSSQGRRIILLVLGLMTMLLYNYYTSSVVSWLLNAVAPTIATMDGLIQSDFELTFEDIGYTRQWLEGPGFYYYSGFKSSKEDELRDKKVKNGHRSVPLLQNAKNGIALVRTGKYAYHTEPYTASQIISRTFVESELCDLGSLQMMPPAPVYMVGQKNSPYKQFFVWSLLRALERGHMSAARRRVGGKVPQCGGRTPRALALGQAAPAFLVLIYGIMLAVLILIFEIQYHRCKQRRFF